MPLKLGSNDGVGGLCEKSQVQVLSLLTAFTIKKKNKLENTNRKSQVNRMHTQPQQATLQQPTWEIVS